MAVSTGAKVLLVGATVVGGLAAAVYLKNRPSGGDFANIQVHVTDSNGLDIGGVAIALGLQFGTTQVTGTAVFAMVPAGGTNLSINQTGYKPVNETVTIYQNNQIIPVTLIPASCTTCNCSCSEFCDTVSCQCLPRSPGGITLKSINTIVQQWLWYNPLGLNLCVGVNPSWSRGQSLMCATSPPTNCNPNNNAIISAINGTLYDTGTQGHAPVPLCNTPVQVTITNNAMIPFELGEFSTGFFHVVSPISVTTDALGNFQVPVIIQITANSVQYQANFIGSTPVYNQIGYLIQVPGTNAIAQAIVPIQFVICVWEPAL